MKECPGVDKGHNLESKGCLPNTHLAEVTEAELKPVPGSFCFA